MRRERESAIRLWAWREVEEPHCSVSFGYAGSRMKEEEEGDEEEGEGAITCMARAQLSERERGRPGQGWAMDWEPHEA